MRKYLSRLLLALLNMSAPVTNTKCKGKCSGACSTASDATTAPDPAKLNAAFQCPHCDNLTLGRHSYLCSFAQPTAEQMLWLQDKVSNLHIMVVTGQDRITALINSVAEWQGRHAIIRHETNLLRNRLHKQTKKNRAIQQNNKGTTDEDNMRRPEVVVTDD